MSKSPGASTEMPVKAPYHRPVATRHFLSESNVTSTRLSESRTSCLASWQSPSSSIQCFHWDRLYSGMSAGMGATVIVRETVVVGVAVVGLSVGVDVADPVGEAGVGVAVAGRDSGVFRGVGVDVVLVGDVVMDLDSLVVVADGGVAAGVAGLTVQAARTARNKRESPKRESDHCITAHGQASQLDETVALEWPYRRQ